MYKAHHKKDIFQYLQEPYFLSRTFQVLKIEFQNSH